MINSIKNKYKLVFILLLILLLFSKYLTLWYYGFKFTGTDDLIYWHMATDYSQGIFHEPYFYGQSYNFPLEAYIAIPFMKLGLAPFLALPIAATIVGVFPFIFFALVLFKYKKYLASYAFLAIPICMSIEYDILTSMSRGFTNGIFFCGFLVYPILKPKSTSSFLLLGLSAGLGFWVNPNSLIFILPILLYVFLSNLKSTSFYLLAILSIIPGVVLWYLSAQFYLHHPYYIAHKMLELSFSLKEMIQNFSNLNSFFEYLFPVFWKLHWMVILVLFLVGVYLLKKDWKKGAVLLFSVLLILFSIGINKVGDNDPGLFLSSSRMFLALPLLVGLSIIWLPKIDFKLNKQLITIVGISALLIMLKVIAIQDKVDFHTKKTYYGRVSITSLDELKIKTNQLIALIKDKPVDLMIFVPSPNYEYSEMALLCYGGKFMNENFPLTNIMNYERRSWNHQEEMNRARNNVLIFNPILGYKPDLNGMETEVLQLSPDVIYIKNNTKTALELSKIFQFPYLRD